jgi:hypothetical protein
LGLEPIADDREDECQPLVGRHRRRELLLETSARLRARARAGSG